MKHLSCYSAMGPLFKGWPYQTSARARLLHAERQRLIECRASEQKSN